MLWIRSPRLRSPASLSRRVPGRRLLGWIGCLLVLGMLTGCASLVERPSGPLRKASTEELLDILERRHADLRTFKGLFQAELQGAGIIPFSHHVDGIVMYSYPETYRFKGFSRVGSVLFDITVDHGIYEAAIPAAGRFMTGRVGDLTGGETFGETVQLTLSAFQGVTGVEPVGRGREVALVEDGAQYRLDVYASFPEGQASRRLARRIFFERQQLQVVREERLSMDGEARVVTSFEDYRAVTPGPESQGPPLLLPFTILVQNSEIGGRLVVSFQEIHANMPLATRDLKRLGLGGAGAGMGVALRDGHSRMIS